MDRLERSQLVGRFRRLSDTAKERCWDFRDHPTLAEAAMWEILHGKKLGGFKFRRQHKIGPFIVDFYCHAANLVVEVDGPIHERQQDEDVKRSAWLTSIGLTVIRFRNEEILNEKGLVKQRILEALVAASKKP